MFPQLAEPHSVCELLHGNSVIQEGRGKIEIRVIGAVSDDQVIGVDIDAEIVDQILLCPPRDRILIENRRCSTKTAIQFRIV